MDPQRVVDHQVVQRTADDGAKVVLLVDDDVAMVRFVDGTGATVASACIDAGPERTAHLEVPIGGPFDLQGRSAMGRLRTLARAVLVGDLWVLAGQSNMQGCGALAEAEPPSPLVHLFDLGRRWSVAKEPLIVAELSPDPAHCEVSGGERHQLAVDADLARRIGAGLGLRFGKEMVERTGVPVGLIAAARGGSSMAEWSPDRRALGGASLYASMLRTVEAAGGRVAGVLWYQGESDAVDGTHLSFREGFSALIQAIRHDLGDAALPFIHVQLGRVLHDEGLPDAWNTVREVQRDLASTGSSGMVSAIDLPLEDWIHIRTDGLQRLGRRLALLASRDMPSPGVRRLELVGAAASRVLVHFDGITGRLRAPGGRVSGFSVRTATGEHAPIIYEAVIPEHDPSAVLLHLSRLPLPGDALWYGYGLDPFCNVVDEVDMAVPAFGPIPLDSLPRHGAGDDAAAT